MKGRTFLRQGVQVLVEVQMLWCGRASPVSRSPHRHGRAWAYLSIRDLIYRKASPPSGRNTSCSKLLSNKSIRRSCHPFPGQKLSTRAAFWTLCTSLSGSAQGYPTELGPASGTMLLGGSRRPEPTPSRTAWSSATQRPRHLAFSRLRHGLEAS